MNRLGPLELAIMQCLWDAAPSSIPAVRATLRGQGRAPAYSTVQTVMNRLVTKGFLVREGAGRALRYRPARTHPEYAGGVLREAWEATGCSAPALARLLAGLTEEQRGALDAEAERGPDGLLAAPDAAVPRTARARLPSDVAGPAAPAERYPEDSDGGNGLLADILQQQLRDIGMTRKQLGEELGLHPATLRRRLARPADLDAGRLAALIRPLRFGAETRATVHRLAGHQPPPDPAGEPAPELAVYQRQIDADPYNPQVYYTLGWEVVLTNQAFRDFFRAGAHVPRHATAMPTQSTLGYITEHPYAYQVLGSGSRQDFHDYWLMVALAQFAATWKQHSARPDVRRMRARLMARRKIWRALQSVPDFIREHGDIAVGTAPRPIFDQRTNRATSVQLVTEEHPGGSLQHCTFMLAD
ncbi:BlaI/MecI/CopY family transcriptional regulator [Streptomyces sclerotialus]|uniref:BlaI/MecI/CopY family transcriptional regulator n=1 Tax=Streptomyces sclerotialus TaxID=1957 RepID=UPI00068C5734